MGEDIKIIGTSSRQSGSEHLRNNVKGFSSFGEGFDGNDAAKARMTARQAMDSAKTPKLYGITEIDFGPQGKASVRRVGKEKRGSLQITVNGEDIGSVDYNENGLGMFRKTADDAFNEAKRRIGYRIKV